jgi:hypothetical protein
LAPDAVARRCLKCLVRDFVDNTFFGLVGFGGKAGAVIRRSLLLLLNGATARQLSDVGGDAAGLIVGEQVRASSFRAESLVDDPLTYFDFLVLSRIRWQSLDRGTDRVRKPIRWYLLQPPMDAAEYESRGDLRNNEGLGSVSHLAKKHAPRT